MWMEILQMLGASSVVSGVLLFIVKRFYERKDKKEEKEEKRKNTEENEHKDFKTSIGDQEEKIKKIEANIADIKSTISSIDDIIATAVEGVRSLLRDKIIQSYNYYCLDSKKKFLPIHTRESLDNIYKIYKELGGEVTIIEDLIERLYSLPTHIEHQDDK